VKLILAVVSAFVAVGLIELLKLVLTALGVK